MARRPGSSSSSPVLRAPMISTQIAFGALIAGREPTAEDIEPLSLGDLPGRQGHRRARRTSARSMQLQALARALVAVDRAEYDAVLTPGARRARRCRSARSTPATATTRWRDFARAGATSRRSRRVSNVTGSARDHVPLYHGDDGLPVGVQLIGQPAGEGALLALAAQLEAARPWASDRRPGRLAAA